MRRPAGRKLHRKTDIDRSRGITDVQNEIHSRFRHQRDRLYDCGAGKSTGIVIRNTVIPDNLDVFGNTDLLLLQIISDPYSNPVCLAENSVKG